MKAFAATTIGTGHGVLASCVTVVLLWLGLPGGGGFWPLLPVACVPFLVAISRGSRRQVFFFALFFGTVHFLIQLYWIIFVVGHYGGLPLYLSVPALVFLCLYLAIYSVVFAQFVRCFLARFSSFVCLWLIPCTWVAMDFLRSFVFSGFPWMDLGYGMVNMPLLLQVADVFGHYGLTFIIVLLNSFFAFCFYHRNELRGMKQMVITVCFVLLCSVFYSTWRMHQLDLQLEKAPFLDVGVVQGNIDQGMKWNPGRQGATVKNYIDQSILLMRGTVRPDLLLWPETALPFFPPGHPLTRSIGSFLQDEEVILLTGAPWFERENATDENFKIFNSSLLFNSNGEIVSMTAKSHLVPFGEYVPLKRYLPFIAPLVEGVGDFIPGKIENPPACKNGRIGVLICFESIFPDISRKWVDAGANIMVNITNDAWYGRSSAPHQTLAMTRMRAVETRRSVVRSANTGFSAFVDPLGRVVEMSPLFVPWQFTGRAYLMEGHTFFVRGGFAFAPGCLIVILAALMVCAGKRKENCK